MNLRQGTESAESIGKNYRTNNQVSSTKQLLGCGEWVGDNKKWKECI